MAKPKDLENIDAEMAKEIELEDIPGVGPETAEKLRDGGYSDLMSIAIAVPGTLADNCGLKLGVAQKIVNEAVKRVPVGGFETAADMDKRRSSMQRLVLNCKSLDELLGGGLESQAITEFAGEFGSGKTQICFQLCVNVQLPVEKGGLDGHAVYIDTENTFRPERIKSMAEALGLNPVDVLGKIHVARAIGVGHQMILTKRLGELAEKYPVKLVVVDSLTSHFRAEYIGRGTLAERQQLLNSYMHELLKIADKYNVVVVATNQVMANPTFAFGDPNRPIGGNIVGHGSTYRVYLRKGQKDKRIAKLIDSPNLPEKTVEFCITKDGIEE